MALNRTDTAVLPVGYVLGIRVYRGPETRITLRPSISLRTGTIRADYHAAFQKSLMPCLTVRRIILLTDCLRVP